MKKTPAGAMTLSLSLVLVLLSGCVQDGAGTGAASGLTLPQETALSQSLVELPPLARTSTEGMFDWRNATVYYAMTDRFHNGDTANDESYGRRTVDAKGSRLATFNGGDFKGLSQKLQEGYFSALGVNALWISAPYEQVHGFVGGGDDGSFAHYAFHGYYALDWTMTDRNFGTREEFRELVDVAHARGIRVILDVVMNHTGYNTLQDMAQYGFGAFKGIDGSWQPRVDQRYDAYHEWIDYSDEAAWARWWGPDWVRSGLPGYERGGRDDLSMTLAGLPDIKTEREEPVALPPVLQTKWEKEAGAEYEPWKLQKAKPLRQQLPLPPAGYINAWLTAWVEEFGIDGFRVDTAKHVELTRWAQLKASAQEALLTWRRQNPDKPGADFQDDFFMVGEVWGMGIEDNDYYDHGFDALINFSFQGEGAEGPAYRRETMPAVFQRYADTLNGQGNNVLSYLSSHDTRLFPRSRLKEGLTYLLLLPGALEVFYGDESGREVVPAGSDLTMGTRSYMNWDSVDLEVQSHFAKLGGFRARNLSVGAGTHLELSKEPFIFKREYIHDGIENRVLVAFGQSPGAVLDVSAAFSDGDLLRDAYSMKGYRVEKGSIRVEETPEGMLLLEKLE